MAYPVSKLDEPHEATGDVARHIAREAARLFAAQGYDATSVREIAEAAGVTKPTLYYHYGSKEGLAQALIVRPLLALIASGNAILDEESGPVVTASRLVEAMFNFCCEDPDRSRFAHSLFFGPPGSPLVADICRHADELDQIWIKLGQRMAVTGTIGPERVEAFVMNLRGVTTLHIMMHLYRGVPLRTELPNQLVDDLLQGFRRERS